MVPWIILGAWLVGMSIGFWHFEFRPQHRFAAPGFVAPGNSQQRAAARLWFDDVLRKSGARPDGASLTVVHVFREGCGCNRFTEPHLAEIMGRFHGRAVRFIRVESQGALAHGMPKWVSSLPAAFVFAADSELLYFGPYSDSAWCGRSGALVEGVLERALQGVPPQPLAATPWGCFCESANQSGQKEPT